MSIFTFRFLTTLSLIAVSVIDGAAAQSQLRAGSDDFRRMLVEATVDSPSNRPVVNVKGWCPEHEPDSGDVCALPTGVTGGNCSYRLGKDGKVTTTDCRCIQSTEVFDCKETVVSEKGKNWCPASKAGTGDKCQLPSGKSGGSCFYRKVSRKRWGKVTTTTECKCKRGNRKFKCSTKKKTEEY
mmetsp:Transcript_13510/g.31604  ORF Transcript_13510/g.31604 Transcript_13510/m.31604 type:complete len:183 (-) Transcript_13510:59-607(-)